MRILVTLLVLIAFEAPAWAQGQRVALVIGVGGYRTVPALANPPRDARSIAEGLRRAGFRTDLVIDPDRAGLERAIRALGAASSRADVVMFFYAGHAVEFNGQNYLIPATAAIQTGRDLPFEAVSLDLVANQVEKARTTLIFLDACRDNPFSLRLGGSDRGIAARGLAAPAASSTGTLVAFATAPGHTASDGSGEHSPFTRALLANIDVPGLEIRQMLGRVRRQVREETGGEQVPWESSALEGEFYFHPSATPAPQPPPPAVVASRPIETPTPSRSPVPRPMQQAMAPRQETRSAGAALCPAAGTEVVRSDGSTLVYAGSDPADPALCLFRTGTARMFYGIVNPLENVAAESASAIRTVLAGAPGAKAAYDDVGRSGFFRREWTFVGDETVTIAGEARRAAHLVDHRSGQVGTHVEFQLHYWIDRADGMLLAQKYEYLSGNRQVGRDFIVVSIWRPG